MARPRKEIDEDQLRTLAAIHCTTDEMAAVMGVHKRTLERRYAAVIEDGRNHGKMSLKRKQYEVAMTGNVPMLIWLGKQHLGQADKQVDGGDRHAKYIVIDKVAGGHVVGESELQKVTP